MILPSRTGVDFARTCLSFTYTAISKGSGLNVLPDPGALNFCMLTWPKQV